MLVFTQCLLLTSLASVCLSVRLCPYVCGCLSCVCVRLCLQPTYLHKYTVRTRIHSQIQYPRTRIHTHNMHIHANSTRMRTYTTNQRNAHAHVHNHCTHSTCAFTHWHTLARTHGMLTHSRMACSFTYARRHSRTSCMVCSLMACSLTCTH